MRAEELLTRLGGLRRAKIGSVRAPHKPLLVLWLLAEFERHGSTAVSYAQAAEPVTQLINEYGPAVRSQHDRAAMPFTHLERRLWELTTADGEPIPPNPSRSGGWLRERGAHGRLRPEVEALLADPLTLATAANLLLDNYFTPRLAELITVDVGLATAGRGIAVQVVAPEQRRRRAGFAEEVLRANAYTCAACGYDGRLGRHPAGLEAAHVRWFSHDGPDEPDNGLALCALHHTLLDLGVLGLTPEGTLLVSPRFTTASEAGRAVLALAGRPLILHNRDRRPPAAEHIAWHTEQVFKATA